MSLSNLFTPNSKAKIERTKIFLHARYVGPTGQSITWSTSLPVIDAKATRHPGLCVLLDDAPTGIFLRAQLDVEYHRTKRRERYLVRLSSGINTLAGQDNTGK
jgi:hypothetical protein